MNDKKKYLLNFFIYFIILYIILKYLEWFMAIFLAFVISSILNITYFGNIMFLDGNTLEIIPACTCSLEMALFLGYVLSTPKIPLKYKLTYSVFGIAIINFGNIIRIILIIKNLSVDNYELLHNIVSFIIFPLALFLNWLWIYILKRKKLIN